MQHHMERQLPQNIICTIPQEQGDSITQIDKPAEIKSVSPWQQQVYEMGEAVVALSLITLCCLCIPLDWIHFHLMFAAFFLLVFAVAMRHHRSVAYGTGVLAGATYLWLGWLRTDLQLNSLHVYIEPFLLLLTAILSTDLMHMHRGEAGKSEPEQEEIQEKLQQTLQQYETALEINAELEKQITGQHTSIALISEKLTQMWKMQGHQRYEALLDIISSALGAETSTLYLQRNDHMRYCTSYPLPTEPQAISLFPDDPLLTYVLTHHRVGTVRDVLTENPGISTTIGVMAGPLFDVNEQIMGIVVINTMPLLKFTPQSVYLFRSLLHMASMALQKDLPVPHTDPAALLVEEVDPDRTLPVTPAMRKRIRERTLQRLA